MVRCAMCDSPAEISYSIRSYGELDVCGLHYDVLLHNDKCKRNEYENKFRDILIQIIDALNKEFIEIESYMGMPPMKRGKCMGKREGLKIAIGEVETELERLIKK